MGRLSAFMLAVAAAGMAFAGAEGDPLGGMRYLYSDAEDVVAEFDSVVRSHPVLGRAPFERTLLKGESVRLTPGSYLIDEETAPGIVRTRYLGVAGRNWTVLQCTVGAFTGDYMDAVFHSVRVPAVYYVNAEQASKDPTFLGWERDYGDDVMMHLHPNGFGELDPKWMTDKANWSELEEDKIVEMLRGYDAWMRRLGYRAPAGFASYTPDNQLIRAMKRVGWPILHSLVPEQNWSDGRWAINHWGMPNQPFYIASDDFRKQTSRGSDGADVIGMSMDTYHPLIPHFLYWGDFVLSPSHFIRSERTLETGYYPERFRNMFEDYLKARTVDGRPFFLIAGFEFGRTLGTRMMMVHNRKGGEIAVELAKKNNVVFATARDVASWYRRFEPSAPETCFALRDYWTGSRQMDKPVNVGVTIACEMRDWKAAFSHLEPLAHYHYDYTIPWSFAARDTTAPHDFASEDREAVSVERTDGRMRIVCRAPLVRPVPVAIWDAEPAEAVFGGEDAREGRVGALRVLRPAKIGDGRRHSVVVLPKGSSGTVEIALSQLSEPDPAEFKGLVTPLWRVQTIGAEHPHVYVTLDSPLLNDTTVTFTCPKPCRIDAPDRPLGKFAAGARVPIKFGPSRNWYRFYGLSAAEVQPDADAVAALEAAAAEYANAVANGPAVLAKEHALQDAWYASLVPEGEEVVLDVDCFGNKLYGQRSRAEKFDRVVRRANDAVIARELADGGASFGPGRACWLNPQFLTTEVSGLDTLGLRPGDKIVVRITSWVAEDPWQVRTYQVRVRSGGRVLDATSGENGVLWSVDGTRSKDNVLALELPASDIKDGKMDLVLISHRPTFLEDWYLSGGFMASVDRVVVSVVRTEDAK